jgi:hypothetical protein
MWKQLNGSKTIIGTCILMASAVCTQVVVGFWAFEPEWMTPVVQTLDWVGIALGGTGLGHKIQKRLDAGDAT